MSRTCVICDGEGKCVDYEDQRSFAMYFTRCERCDGKGYIEKEVMGETISFSSSGAGRGAPQPESSQVAELVRKARQKYNDTLPSYGHREVLDWYGYLELCDALEESERKAERLREDNEIISASCDGIYQSCQELKREVERLRGVLGTLVYQIEDWEQAVQSIVGKRKYPWKDLEEAKAVLASGATREREER